MKLFVRPPIYLAMVVSFGVSGFPPAAHADKIPTLGEILKIERQIIESRKAIRSGRVTIHLRTPVFNKNPSMVGMDKKYTVYFEGNNIRFDRIFLKGDQASREQFIYGKETYVRAYPDARKVQLFGPSSRPINSTEFPDPRRLGVVDWFFETISSRGYERMLLRPNRDQFKIETGSDGPESVWKVSFRIAQDDKKLGEYWLSRDKGNLPLYVAVHSTVGNTPISQSIRIKLQEYTHGAEKIWFPSEVTLQSIHEGEVYAEEIATVEDAVFGENIPDEIFTLAGLELPEGTVVNADGRILTWNGARLLETNPTLLSEQKKLIRTSGPRLWLVVISIFLAIFAILLWYRRYQQTKTE